LSELRVGRVLRRPTERHGSAGDACKGNDDCDLASRLDGRLGQSRAHCVGTADIKMT
jgi:hypothetical protein